MSSLARESDSNRGVAAPLLHGNESIRKYLAEIAALARDARATSNPTVRRDSIQVLVMQIETLQGIARAIHQRPFPELGREPFNPDPGDQRTA